MRTPCYGLILAFVTLQSLGLHADQASQVKKAIERSTLNQPSTRPFHLKATIAPSFERDKDAGRTGEVEIWWSAPDKWRREVRSPEFHQIEIVNGAEDWQENEGDYFPEWLLETSIELVNPVPNVEDVLRHAKDAEVHQFHLQTKKGPMSQINLDWITETGTPEVKNIQRSGVALNPDTDLLLYTNGFGWGAEFKDYQKFHGLMVSRTVSHGTPEVTAKVVVLEDLGRVPPGFLDVDPKAEGSKPMRTELINEVALRRNLHPTGPIVWPPLQDGVLEGNVTSWILVDQSGAVREMDGIVSENSAINDAGRQAIMGMRFEPFVVNGMPVQVYSQITAPFKTTRPAGRENFDSARNYFARGRKVSFPSGAGKPYVVKAEFQFRGKDGKVETGHYEDTWLRDERWIRRAEFEKSHCVRSRNGEERFRSVDGDQAAVFCLVLKMIEPIPALDTFYESDWRVKRDTLNGISAVRVLTGYESPAGKLDPTARSYWFDDSGVLLKTHTNGIETLRSEFQEFNGTRIARRIDVLKDGQLAMRINITDVSLSGELPAKAFELKGHEWQRAFTDEAR